MTDGTGEEQKASQKAIDPSKVRLIQVNPMFAQRYWPLLEEMFRQSSGDPLILSRLRGDVLSGALQVWMLTEDGNKPRTAALAVTRLMSDPTTGRRSLYIAELGGYLFIPIEAWKKGIEVLEDFARENGCSAIHANTINGRVKKLCRGFGFEESSWFTKDVM